MSNSGIVDSDGEKSGNSSGQGEDAIVPAELAGWNWGAFLLTLIWGLSHNLPRALMMLVPVANVVLPFKFGARGNEWAWRARYWESIEQFKSTQRKWAIAGSLMWVISILLAAYLVVPLRPVSEPVAIALNLAHQDPKVQAMLGEPIEQGWSISGNEQTSGSSGQATLFIPVSGPRGSGTLYLDAERSLGKWTVKRLGLVMEKSGKQTEIVRSKPPF